MLDVVTAMGQLTARELKFILENINPASEISDIKIAMNKCSEQVSTKARKQIVKSESEAIDVNVVDITEWKAASEKELLGISMTCSAVDTYKDISDFTCKDCYKMLRNNKGVNKSVIASVIDIDLMVTKKGENPGQEMCQVNIADSTGSIRMVMFPAAYAKNKNKLRKDGKYELTIKGTGSGWCVESLIEIN
jgi:DNA polymerase III alpha subunit